MAGSTIAIKITGNTADITNKIKQVNANLSTMGTRANVTKAKMTGLGNSFTGIMGKASALSAGFLGIAAAIRAVSGTLKVLANFGFEMSKVQAISGATGEQLEEMTALARKMGATTMFTATQAAEGMKFLSMAGFNAKETMQALPATLALAQAGTIDLARASDIASNVMAAFGIEADGMNSVADDMVTIVNSANTNVQQLGDAMKYVGAAAAASGITIPTVSAAIGVLSNAGMQGAMAGTGLRQVFIRLTNVTRASEDALRGMGLSMDQVNPQKVGLTEAIHRLSEAGMTGAEAIKIFGARGAVAALNLAAGLDKYHELKDAMDNNEGAAVRVAKVMETNLMGAFKLFKSALQEAVLALGGKGDKGLTGGLRNALGVMTEWIRILNDTGDVSSKFHDAAMKMKKVLDRVWKAAKLFFHIWVGAKIVKIITAIGTAVVFMATKAVAGFAAMRGAMAATTAGLAATTAGVRALTIAIATTGLGAIIVGLGALAASLMGSGDAADIAAAKIEKLNAARQQWVREKVMFELPKGAPGEGGARPKEVDMSDLKDVGAIESMQDLQSQIQIADHLTKMWGAEFERFGKLIAENTTLDTSQIREAMNVAGIEGEADWDGWDRAMAKMQDNALKAGEMVRQLQTKRVATGVKENEVARKHNALLQERLEFMKEMGEVAKRGIAADDSQAGTVEALKERIRRTKEEMELVSGSEGKAATAEESKKFDRLDSQLRILEEQLTIEQELLKAKLQGSAALEKMAEQRRKVIDVMREEEKHEQRVRDQKISEKIFGKGEGFKGGAEGTPMDLINQLADFEAQSKKVAAQMASKHTMVGTGDKSFDMYGNIQDTLKQLDRFRAGGELELEGQSFGADAMFDELNQAYQKFQKLREKGDKKYGRQSRPFVHDKKLNETDLLQTYSGVLEKLGSGDEAEKLKFGTAAGIVDRMKEHLKDAGPQMREMWRNAYTETGAGGEGAVFNREGLQKFFDFVRSNNKNIDEQGGQIAAKKKAILDTQIAGQKLLNMERRKEIHAQNKVLTADNKSLDMQKRRLKLMADKVGGGKGAKEELAQMEGQEQVADHMFKYEKTLREKNRGDLVEDAKGDLVPRMSEDEIQKLLADERAIASDVISREIAAKGKGAEGRYGVSSLAKIAGGGGVGASGGMTELDAAKLGNKLLERANQLAEQGVAGINKVAKAVGGAGPSISNEFGDPISITQ